MHTDEQKILTSIRLEPTGVPIYVQLRDQFLRAIGAGALSPGAQMPTMRQVAVALRVDLNTVRHAYDALERMGAIKLERGRGSFVSATPPPVDHHAQARNTDNLAKQAIALAAAAGVDPLVLAARIADIVQNKETSS
jgi:GntR family transcriptional regulator